MVLDSFGVRERRAEKGFSAERNGREGILGRADERRAEKGFSAERARGTAQEQWHTMTLT
jgi:hypothetical protein